jgi:hypothetical protein
MRQSIHAQATKRDIDDIYDAATHDKGGTSKVTFADNKRQSMLALVTSVGTQLLPIETILFDTTYRNGGINNVFNLRAHQKWELALSEDAILLSADIRVKRKTSGVTTFENPEEYATIPVAAHWEGRPLGARSLAFKKRQKIVVNLQGTDLFMYEYEELNVNINGARI